MLTRLFDRVAIATLGPAPAETMPERVRAAIREQQAQAEVLIGWVQLLIVSFFGLFYAVSPKTFASDAPFEPVPTALGIYFVFTVVRLLLAYRRRLAPWFLALSVVIDMTLLFGLIWSFHLQYGQPPGFYLKAPTVLYVFIFICLRALRFDARFVLLSGLVAAAGWGFLVWYAVSDMSIRTPITRDYVGYLTSNLVLIGAEMDKIISILFVTAILSLAILRARRLLIRSTVEAEAAQDLSRFFSPDVAASIRASEDRIRPGEGQLRDASILMCDLRGFTARAMTMAPNDVMTLLANYERRMVRVIQAHGGAVDKFLGDGVMASFGAVVRSETHAADALAAIQSLGAEVEAWNAKRAGRGAKPVAVNFAVASGPVMVGAVGADERLEFTVIGDPVNLAAKLEKHNKVERTRALASAATVALARAQGHRQPYPMRQGVAVAGAAEPVDLAVLLG